MLAEEEEQKIARGLNRFEKKVEEQNLNLTLTSDRFDEISTGTGRIC